MTFSVESVLLGADSALLTGGSPYFRVEQLSTRHQAGSDACKEILMNMFFYFYVDKLFFL